MPIERVCKIERGCIHESCCGASFPLTELNHDLSEKARFCREIILAAGALAMEGYRQVTTRSSALKGPQDYLTETDAACERFIRQRIAQVYPDDGFYGEEEGGLIASRTWVVDPIDGTANFARNIPHFCISIAYVAAGEVQIGAIYNPVIDELYFARRGCGATKNDVLIAVAATDRFDSTSVELGWSTRRPNSDYLATAQRILALGANVRRAGSGALALAYVAEGRSDAYAELHMNSWDCLAGLLIVEEAGGRVCPYLETGTLETGGPVLAAAPGIAIEISEATGISLA